MTRWWIRCHSGGKLMQGIWLTQKSFEGEPKLGVGTQFSAWLTVVKTRSKLSITLISTKGLDSYTGKITYMYIPIPGFSWRIIIGTSVALHAIFMGCKCISQALGGSPQVLGLLQKINHLHFHAGQIRVQCTYLNGCPDNLHVDLNAILWSHMTLCIEHDHQHTITRGREHIITSHTTTISTPLLYN